MNKLFDIKPDLPEGFEYYPGFLSIAEQEMLLGIIGQYELKPMQFHEYEAKRKVLGFGRGWSFTNQELVEGTAIPTAFNFIMEKVGRALQLPFSHFAQMLLTEYPPGAVINWHRDAAPFHTIAGISLLSDISFKLRPQEKTLQTRSATKVLLVEKGSLYCMKGIAKNEWQHATAPAKCRRISITFRTLQ
ncbi:MAG: alpha-ketoglutarate-dependent dioxygenase AlkB [Chitinophagaceae bacterium]|nr:MAG: alpha-ketoglutarate-dependent dioxygenase AlkB [Chitinophagaceae bacterium]